MAGNPPWSFLTPPRFLDGRRSSFSASFKRLPSISVSFFTVVLRHGDLVAISRDRRSHEMSGGISVRGWDIQRGWGREVVGGFLIRRREVPSEFGLGKIPFFSRTGSECFPETLLWLCHVLSQGYTFSITDNSADDVDYNCRVVLMFILLRPESVRTATVDSLDLSRFMFCLLDVSSSTCKWQEIPHGHS